MSSSEPLVIDGRSLTIEDVAAVARQMRRVTLSPKAKALVDVSSGIVEDLAAKGAVAYGLTTGVGPLNTRIVSTAKARDLQVNLIRSHTAGVGEPLRWEVVRACMLLRANALARGLSGVRLKTLQTLVDMLNMDIHPVVPRLGSVGASGDLVPLAHIASALMGEGQVMYGGQITDGRSAMRKVGIPTVDLSFKEGLALINGTSLTTAMAALAISDAGNLLKNADIAAAMTLESLRGITEPFDERIHAAKPHAGQVSTARNIQQLIEGSQKVVRLPDIRSKLEATYKPHEMTDATRESGIRIQDAYSLQCIPQLMGAAKDALVFIRGVVEVEVNSATDSPLVMPTGEVLHGGNFHDQHIALAMDTLSIALTAIGNTAERRIALLLNGSDSNGLPKFLITDQTQPTFGFMGLQNSATALAAENRILSTPATIQAIPTNADNQDIASMSAHAADKALRILANVELLLAIELICAAQGIELRGAAGLGKGTTVAFRVVRSMVPFLYTDRPLHMDVERLVRSVHSGAIVAKVEEAVSRLE